MLLDQMRWLAIATAALLSQAACSTTVAATRGADRLFDGDWAHVNKCGFGQFINISFDQTGSEVSGEWDEGTTVRGSDGLLKGVVRDGKLFVQYCGDDEASGYPMCPAYGSESSYFMRDGTNLVRFQLVGHKYRKDVVLHQARDGKALSECRGGVQGR